MDANFGLQNTNVAKAEEEFIPVLTSNQTILCKISPAKFDGLVKVLSNLDGQSIIAIKNSMINQLINKGTAILIANISDLIGENIDFQILDPKKHIRLFKQLKGNNDVFIINDPDNERYIITNQDVSIFLGKQIEELNDAISTPDLSTAITIGAPITLEKNDRDVISSFMKEADYIDLLLQNDQLKGVSLPGLAVIKFKNFIKDNIDDVSANLKLRSYAFLKVDGEQHVVNLAKTDDNYWILTQVNTGYLLISILETVNPVSDDKLLL